MRSPDRDTTEVVTRVDHGGCRCWVLRTPATTQNFRGDQARSPFECAAVSEQVAALRRNSYGLPATTQRHAEETLACPGRVGVRGVEPRNPTFNCIVDKSDRLSLIDPRRDAAEPNATESKNAHVDATVRDGPCRIVNA